MYFVVKDAAGVETRRVSFAYEISGNPRYVVTSRPADPVRHAYSLHYTKQNALWLTIKEEWQVGDGQVTNHRRLAAEEIVTEGVGIARTLTRRLAPPENDPDGQTSPLAWEFVSEVQRDHDGDERTGEFAVGPQGDATATAEYFGALGRQLINATGGPVYDGHDQVGSAVLTTDAQSGSNNGARMSRRYFTAFGERVAELGESGQPPPSWAATTFGYCGAWGYQGSAEWPTESNFGDASSGGGSGGGSGGSPSSDNFWESDLGVLHVGARWYWPDSGRFIQRDPIGIAGGTNSYSYAAARPSDRVDPTGRALIDPFSTKGFGAGSYPFQPDSDGLRTRDFEGDHNPPGMPPSAPAIGAELPVCEGPALPGSVFDWPGPVPVRYILVGTFCHANLSGKLWYTFDPPPTDRHFEERFH
ncbi:MAG: RHS repeat-associated core domain-containing protein [Phycisphaerae bacterium]